MEIPAFSSQLSVKGIGLPDTWRKIKFTTYSQGLLVDDDFVKASFDQASTDMLKLFASLYQKIVPFRNSDRNTLSSISRPYMESRIS